MKNFKKFMILSVLSVIFLAGCDNEFVTIDEENWASENGETVQDVFNQQIQQSKFIEDLKSITSLNTGNLGENEGVQTNLDIDVSLDNASSVKGGINFTDVKVEKNDDSNSEISFTVSLSSPDDEIIPLDTTGSFSLLNTNGNAYAQFHNFEIFMGEGNMEAKMYSLLSDLIVDKRIDLQATGDSLIKINNESSFGSFESSFISFLETQDIDSSDNSNLNSNLSLVLDTINTYTKFGINTQDVKLVSHEDIEYRVSENETIQKLFTGTFTTVDSEFDLSFVASREGIELKIYNIKDSNNENIDKDFYISISQGKESGYDINLVSNEEGKETANISGHIDIEDILTLTANFVLEPSEIFAGQKMSGEINGSYGKSITTNIEMPTVGKEVLLLSDLMESI